MKLRILSDVHLEFGKFPRGRGAGNEDVVVAAGDIGPGLAGAQWLLRTFAEKPVIYVPGNHEFYNRIMERLEDDLDRKCAGSNVLIARHPGRCIELGNVRFLATTLWTDFGLHGNPEEAMHEAKREMTDYVRIRVASPARKAGVPLQPTFLLDRHRAAVAWLRQELARPWDGKTVLVTHHSPTAATLEFPDEYLSSCYASNLEDLLDGDAPDRPAVDLAIHGHVHMRADVLVKRTRVVVNARGYVGSNQVVAKFDPQLVVEI